MPGAEFLWEAQDGEIVDRDDDGERTTQRRGHRRHVQQIRTARSRGVEDPHLRPPDVVSDCRQTIASRLAIGQRGGESELDRRQPIAHQRTQRLDEAARVRARTHSIRSGHRNVERDTLARRHDGPTGRPYNSRATRYYFLSCVMTTT